MPLFQNAVVKKYLNAQNKNTILAHWNVYKNHFLNPTIQENIRNSKEEQYQGEFLIDLFVNVLGYTKNPTPNFNLTTELKNEKDSKKADGGILLPRGLNPLDNVVIGVIELKGTNTTDLNKIEVQAFGYKNNQKDCVYVITSNFEKLRFYIDNAIEHLEFNLFQLTQKEFELLYLCLAYTNISKHIPKKLKEESLSQEDIITKELYKDYSLFKNSLFHSLTVLNPDYEPLELFKKSQKLLDRFLFLFFAEDRQLLPPNSVRLILDDWKDLQEKDVYIPLYDRYKKYFEYLNTGYKGKRYDVFAYNGGLFKPDVILDNVKIDDDLLYKHTLKLSDYDFESEVDVNILGHIFENSLNELDEMKAQLNNPMGLNPLKEPLDKQISKRKKDGVFYTPKYITKYIVENTVGKLCTAKKLELEINENDYFNGLKPIEENIVNFNGFQPIEENKLNSKGFQPLVKNNVNSNGLKPIKENIVNFNGFQPIEENKLNFNGFQPIEENKLNSKGFQPLVKNNVNSNGLKPIKENIVNFNGFQPIEENKLNSKGFQPLVKNNVNSNDLKPIGENNVNSNGLKPLEKKTHLSKKEKEANYQKLIAYRNWLLQITIIDPACGSGAFLNEALNFLIAEHTYIDELQAKLFGDAMVMSDVEKSILENNLFGVDLNEESVEIAKLSLWLRTAQPNRKLNDLNHNIKCGNSLIDDPEIAGEKAFNWQNEFPQIFKLKKLEAYHLVFTTHNSRTSQRMIDYNVKKGDPVEFNLEQEIVITELFKNIVLENNYKVLAYNICKDHIHIIIVCEFEELHSIAQKLKGVSSRMYTSKGFKPLGEPLWSQKFYFADLEVLKPSEISHIPGYCFKDAYIDTATKYITNNREKHNLPYSKELVKIISEFTITQEDAFVTEYKGGFDVVIGNPPYVQLQSMGAVSDDLQKMNYQTFEKTSDLYCLFHELGNIILKENGLLGFITSNKWLRANYGKSLRNYLLANTQPLELIDLGSGIFDSATVDSNILIFKKTKNNKKPFIGMDISKEKKFTDFTVFESNKVEISPKVNDIWSISNVLETKIKNKIEAIGTPLKDWNIKINYGIKTGFNDAFIIDEITKNDLIQKDAKNAEIILPILRGRDIKRYNYDYQNLYLINVHNGYGDIPEVKIEDYPIIKEHLDRFYPQLEKRGDKGKTPYNLRNCAYIDDFFNEKIIWKEMSSDTPFTIDKKGYFTNDTITFLTGNDLKYLLVLLNSKLSLYIFSKYYSGGGLGSNGLRFKKEFLSNLPLIKINFSEQHPFIEKAELMLSLSKEFQLLVQKFIRSIEREFFSFGNGLKPIGEETNEIIVIPKKLQDWYLLSYTEFLQELEKKRKSIFSKGFKPLGLSQKAEWEDYFMQESKKALDLKNIIDATDKAIDKMVYELYGLSEEEILIVENS